MNISSKKDLDKDEKNKVVQKRNFLKRFFGGEETSTMLIILIIVIGIILIGIVSLLIYKHLNKSSGDDGSDSSEASTVNLETTPGGADDTSANVDNYY